MKNTSKIINIKRIEKMKSNTKRLTLATMLFASVINSNVFASNFTDIATTQGREYIQKFIDKGI